MNKQQWFDFTRDDELPKIVYMVDPHKQLIYPSIAIADRINVLDGDDTVSVKIKYEKDGVNVTETYYCTQLFATKEEASEILFKIKMKRYKKLSVSDIEKFFDPITGDDVYLCDTTILINTDWDGDIDNLFIFDAENQFSKEILDSLEWYKKPEKL